MIKVARNAANYQALSSLVRSAEGDYFKFADSLCDSENSINFLLQTKADTTG